MRQGLSGVRAGVSPDGGLGADAVERDSGPQRFL